MHCCSHSIAHLHWRNKTVHVVAAVAVVTEQELVVVLAGAAQGARLALHALPGVLLHTQQHVLSELKKQSQNKSLELLLENIAIGGLPAYKLDVHCGHIRSMI